MIMDIIVSNFILTNIDIIYNKNLSILTRKRKDFKYIDMNLTDKLVPCCDIQR